ncbi:protease SohB [Halomonas vilamensis]|uniref:Protease SohB n=1 Tax=Vreelandella vilamensis TaxID=531309 RepID=A0ABU1H1W8_9GAMM|nr:protease SohB [Halomonas vilamensis]MDR5898312.1 protease SohB [Halomonas vilamensis]
MGEWITELGTFLLQTVVVVALIGIGIMIVMRAKEGADQSLTLRIDTLNDQRRYRRRRLKMAAIAPSQRKKLLKAFRRDDKTREKSTSKKSEDSPESRVWVLDFHGDIKASATEHFAEEISAIIEVAEANDEVVVRLESGGGLVHAYGLAAAQVDRLREAGLTTTVCIDKVAASGGYLMACSATHIKAAPFAVIGSIGVVAQVPNIHRLLKRHDIDVELLTAGKYKRTLTVLGENTDEGREKFIDDLENTHRLFKAHVAERRPEMDIERLATGEIWYGSEALACKLIDSVQTSEAYLVERMQKANVLHVALEPPQTISRKLGMAVSYGIEHAGTKALSVLEASRWYKQ